MRACRVSQHAAWAAGISTRLLRTSLFEAPPRAIHGALSEIPAAHAACLCTVGQRA